MKARVITYWISTGLTAAMMTLSAVLYLTRNPKMMAAFTGHLGYPGYFPTILGVAKLLGLAALLAPRLGRLKEWAYAGFTFTFIGAFLSHLAVGDTKDAVAPLVSLVLLAASYLLRPADRRPADRSSPAPSTR